MERPCIHALMLIALVLAGCTERALPIADSTTIDCAHVVFDPAGPTQVCEGVAGFCSISGALTDGRRVRESCANDSCTLFVDDVLTCTCPTAYVDFNNICPSTGVPTCDSWIPNWNEIAPCEAP